MANRTLCTAILILMTACGGVDLDATRTPDNLTLATIGVYDVAPFAAARLYYRTLPDGFLETATNTVEQPPPTPGPWSFVSLRYPATVNDVCAEVSTTANIPDTIHPPAQLRSKYGLVLPSYLLFQSRCTSSPPRN